MKNAIALQLDAEIRYHAQKILRWVSDHDEAPEGIELYEWHWIAGDKESLKLEVGDRTSRASALSGETALPLAPISDLVEIMPKALRWTITIHDVEMAAAVGFDEWHRIGVLFFANGGDLKGGIT